MARLGPLGPRLLVVESRSSALASGLPRSPRALAVSSGGVGGGLYLVLGGQGGRSFRRGGGCSRGPALLRSSFLRVSESSFSLQTQSHSLPVGDVPSRPDLPDSVMPLLQPRLAGPGAAGPRGPGPRPAASPPGPGPPPTPHPRCPRRGRGGGRQRCGSTLLAHARGLCRGAPYAAGRLAARAGPPLPLH